MFLIMLDSAPPRELHRGDVILGASNQKSMLYPQRKIFYLFLCLSHTKKFGRVSSFGTKSLNSSLVKTSERILRLI